MNKASRLTKQFLCAYSKYISGRKDCSKIEYVVCIGVSPLDVIGQITKDEKEAYLLIDALSYNNDYENQIFDIPAITVFPDIHHRKNHDRIRLVTHLIWNRFYEELYDSTDQYDVVKVRTDNLVRGIWMYKFGDNNRRRWVRLK